ncbi:hypothetical protein FEM08_02450 [Flavobacterium gilvum]|nr:hypothetical protein FEM08_02450 [Flavobacterium gilvum]
MITKFYLEVCFFHNSISGVWEIKPPYLFCNNNHFVIKKSILMKKMLKNINMGFNNITENVFEKRIID